MLCWIIQRFYFTVYIRLQHLIFDQMYIIHKKCFKNARLSTAKLVVTATAHREPGNNLAIQSHIIEQFYIRLLRLHIG